MKSCATTLLPLFFLIGAIGLRAEQAAPTASVRDDAAVKISPGEDFFTYVNGPWMRAHPLTPDRSDYSVPQEVSDLVREQVKVIGEKLATDAATDADAKKLTDFMLAANLAETRAFALPPTLRDAFARLNGATTREQILVVAAGLQRSGVSSFYSFGAGSDAKNSDLVVAGFDQGGLTLPERDYYLSETGSVLAARKAFPAYVATLLRHAGYDAAAAAKAGEAVLGFERELATISRPMEELRVIEKNYHPMSPVALAQLAPGIPWDALKTAYGLKREPDVVVGQPEFFGGLDTLLAKTPVETLKAYLRFHALDAMAPFINRETSDDQFAFHGRVLRGVTEQRPAEIRALRARDKAMGELIGKRYVAAHFPASLRARYLAMCENFRTVLAERFAANPWMDAPTKESAGRKLAKMRFKVGYPDVWKDYSKLSVTADDYAENMSASARLQSDLELSEVGGKPDRERWGMNPQECNAYYDPSNNELVFPAASFVIPGVDPLTMDDAMTYGFIGGTIGHEMTHAFDDEGRKFDGKGDLADWWTPASAAAFEKQVKPIMARYSAVKPVAGIAISGEATLGENLADLGGLAIALDAFKRTDCYKSGRAVGGMTPLRRFFVAYAYSWAECIRPEELQRRLLSDVHSPSKERVNLVVPNFSEFHEAFGIVPGDKMWLAPEERSTVW